MGQNYSFVYSEPTVFWPIKKAGSDLRAAIGKSYKDYIPQL